MIIIAFLLIFQITPSELSNGTLSSDGVVFNEFMPHPLSSSTEADGEWIEIYNRSNEWVNLSGWTITNNLGEEVTLSTYLLPPDSYFVLCACGDESNNGGLTPDYVYSNFTMNDTGELTLFNRSRSIVDHIEYDNNWPINAGSSCERINPGWVSNLPSSWEESSLVFGNGDYGTPGLQNSVYENSFAQNSWAFIKAFVQ